MTSISKIRKNILSGRTSAEETVKKSLDKAKSQQELNCWISIDSERAFKKACRIDRMVRKGADPGPLAGLPVGIKDNMLLKGTKTTCASKMLQNYNSPYTATAVEKLEEAGAIVIGKTNMDEFAMGSSGETSTYGPALNPLDRERTPGGSSSGSAAAVADMHVLAALGSDTGGSVRQPAALCGIVGFKPTYGLVSRYGIVPFASSLDQVAPLTSTVEDAAHMMQSIAGYDSRDSTSIKKEVPSYTEDIYEGIEGIKVGVPAEYMQEGVDKEVKGEVARAAEKLRALGAQVKEISLPHTSYALSVYYIIAPAEASANLARFDGLKFGLSHDSEKNMTADVVASRTKGFGSEVKRRIMLGTYVLSSGYYEAYYSKAQKVRALVKQDFKKAFENVDVIFAPTSPTTAFKLGERTDDVLKMYLSDIFTIPANLAGIPALNIPVGRDSASLPIGAQFMGDYLSEALILRVARALEKELKNDEEQ